MDYRLAIATVAEAKGWDDSLEDSIPGSSCSCVHPWHDHLVEGLVAEDGRWPRRGLWYCPFEGCACYGTWDIDARRDPS